MIIQLLLKTNLKHRGGGQKSSAPGVKQAGTCPEGLECRPPGDDLPAVPRLGPPGLGSC